MIMQQKLQIEEYKQTELGELPKSWEVVKLGDFNYVKILKSGVDEFGDSKYYLSTSSIENNKIRQIECNITYKNRPSRANMQPILNSVWFAKMKNTVKVYSFTEKNVDELSMYILSTGFLGILCNKKKVFPKYLELIFLSPWFNSIKDSASHGSTQQAVNNNDIKSFQIPLPPLPEQQKIAYVLSTVQNAQEKTENFINSLKEFKKSVMKHLFTYGTVPFDEIDKVELKETEIGMMPKEWEVITIGELVKDKIIKIQNGFPCGNWNEKGNGISHLRPFNINEDGNVVLNDIKYVQTDKDVERYLLHLGDVLFNNTNSEELVGKTAFWNIEDKFVLSNHMTIIRIQNKRVLNSKFLASYLHKKWWDGLYLSLCRRHVNQASIGVSRLKFILIPYPPLFIQQKIASILSTIDEKIQAEEQKKEALKETFNSLLKNLMSAKIRVNNLEVGA